MGERQKILIMDDRPDPLYAAQRRLERAGHEVFGVQTYWSAINMLLAHHLRGERFDIAFIDLEAGEPDPEQRERLPTMIDELLEGYYPPPGSFSGVHVVPALKHALRHERDGFGQPKSLSLKTIWWTGHSGNKEYEREAMHQGVVDYVDKTENPVEIIERNSREYPAGTQGKVLIYAGLTGVGKTELERMIELILGKENIRMYRRIGNRRPRHEHTSDTIPMRFSITDEMRRIGRTGDATIWESYQKEYFVPITELGAEGMLKEIAAQQDMMHLGDELNKVATAHPAQPTFHSIEHLTRQGIDVMVAFGNAMAARQCMLNLKRHSIPHSAYLLDLENKHEHMRRFLMKYDVPERILVELPFDAPLFFETGKKANEEKHKVLQDIGFYDVAMDEQDRQTLEKRIMHLGAMQQDFDWFRKFTEERFDMENFYRLKNQIVEQLIASRLERAA